MPLVYLHEHVRDPLQAGELMIGPSRPHQHVWFASFPFPLLCWRLADIHVVDKYAADEVCRRVLLASGKSLNLRAKAQGRAHGPIAYHSYGPAILLVNVLK